ncbi:coiled-coil domain-containing protein 106-like [Carassius auratus]|uniref:Coiled-coil domain-containing protein 106-like n=1 Tax=Carassius auratus TaxID=7957 RepID=A0A6P6NGY0_CARAU|nr:coiled-coil domain-containing protein 106-like [Carassius auratus]
MIDSRDRILILHIPMFRRRKTRKTRALPVLDKNERYGSSCDEENEVPEQSVGPESNPDASYPDTAPAASCESEKGVQASVDESPVDNLLKRIEALEQERDFLRHTLASVCGKEKKKKKKKKDTSSESDELNSSSSSSSSSLPSSSSEDERCSKKKSKKKRTQKNRSRSAFSSSAVRAKCPDDVLKRYKKVLRAFKKEGSMTRAFIKVGVDRNTLALTAVVAEIQIISPEFFRSIPQFQPQQEKLFDFALRCSEALTTEMKASITSGKKSGKLLPIKYKFR